MIKKHIPIIRMMTRERSVLVAWIAFATLGLITILTAALNVMPYDRQILQHYTGFEAEGNINHFYFGGWLYLVNYAVFAVLIFLGHSLIAGKLFVRKGSYFATLFLWISAVLFIVVELLLIGIFHFIVANR